VRQIGVINMTVAKAPGANDIDLNALTLQCVSDERIVSLVANNSEVVEEHDPRRRADREQLRSTTPPTAPSSSSRSSTTPK
jgi:hypothetical protein